MQKGRERRQFKRIRKPFLGKFKVKPSRSKAKKDVWDQVAVLDLGEGGILFYHTKKIKLDALIDLKIEFPEKKTSIKCMGKVLRSEEIGNGDMYLVALVFVKLTDKSQKTISSIVKKYYPKHKS